MTFLSVMLGVSAQLGAWVISLPGQVAVQGGVVDCHASVEEGQARTLSIENAMTAFFCKR